MTAREKEILQQVRQGNTSRNIACHLGISERTVKFHLGNIFRKLQVKNRTEAVALAVENGWLASP